MNYSDLTKPYLNDLLKAIDHFVSIPSVYDAKTANESMPYGVAVNNALKEFAKLGEIYGFKVDLDKRYCELSIGESGPLIEIFGHLDVVPVNKLKDRDMFKVVNKDGVLYARGVADDKGPLLASFYAVKALKDNGLIKDARIKIFAGGDEERGGTCLDSYVKEKHKETPKYGFTPDSKFPMVYGEKAIGNFTFSKEVKFKHVISIKGGLANNIVIPKATFIVDNINEIKDKIKVNHEINNDEITFIGVAAHGATPQNGINAFLLGLEELGRINQDEEMIKISNAFKDYQGKGLNAYVYGEHMHNTVYNLGIATYENNILTIKINSRLPENADAKILSKNIANTLGMNIVSENYTKYLLHDLKSNLVTALLDAYQKETNDYETMPSISGGGTYAKEVGNTIAFGAEPFNVDYKMHQDEEFIPISHLEKQMAIYAHAIHNLIKIK